jgi:hypothetical protein
LIAGLFAVALPVLLAADAGGGAVPAAPATVPAAPASNGADTSSPNLLAPVPPPPQRTVETERVELKDAKDGTGDLVYEASGFTARIAPDGSVRFTEKRATGLSALPWLPMGAQMGVPSLQSSLKMLLKGKAPPPRTPTEIDQGLAPPETKQLIPDVSRYRPDAREGCRACPNFGEVAVPFQGLGRFDLTDELTRFSGKDPNRQQKAMFLASTRDRRIEMAVRTHAANIRRARAELPAQLQAIACNDRLTYKERRAILVALGKEMDPATPEGAASAKAINTFVDRYDSGDVACAR